MLEWIIFSISSKNKYLTCKQEKLILYCICIYMQHLYAENNPNNRNTLFLGDTILSHQRSKKQRQTKTLLGKGSLPYVCLS